MFNRLSFILMTFAVIPVEKLPEQSVFCLLSYLDSLFNLVIGSEIIHFFLEGYDCPPTAVIALHTSVSACVVGTQFLSAFNAFHTGSINKMAEISNALTVIYTFFDSLYRGTATAFCAAAEKRIGADLGFIPAVASAKPCKTGTDLFIQPFDCYKFSKSLSGQVFDIVNSLLTATALYLSGGNLICFRQELFSAITAAPP